MSLKDRLTDSKVIRFAVDLLVCRGDFIRSVIQYDLINSLIGDGYAGTVLDNGCGRGLYTRALLGKSDRIEAIDLNQENINCLKRRFANGMIRFQRASSTALPFEDNIFDLVLHTEVLEHIENDESAVREISRVLKPGGRLILSVPVPPAPIVDNQHVREGYTMEEIESLLDRFSLKIIKTNYCIFRTSRRIIKLSSWWNKYLHMPLPGIFKLPLYFEKWFIKGDERDLPYDLIVEACLNTNSNGNYIKR